MSVPRTLINKAALSVLVATITGCATPKDFYAADGSRADGTVDMAYDFRPFEKPVVNNQQAFSIAKQKCSVWGYNNAEPFGGQVINCYTKDGWGNCTAGQVIIKYQCIGNIDTSHPAAVAPASLRPTTGQSLTGAAALSKEEWRQQQIQLLKSETGLSYEEYQQRYRLIMEQ